MTTIPTAQPTTTAARRAARIDPGKTYMVKAGARKVSGAPTGFAAGSIVGATYPDGSGRADYDGDVFVSPVKPDGTLDTARANYVWAVDLVEYVAQETVTLENLLTAWRAFNPNESTATVESLFRVARLAATTPAP